MDFVRQLAKVTANVLVTKEMLQNFSKDKSPYHGDLPIAVVTPNNTRQLSKIMKLCYKNNVGMTVRGAGTSLTGASIPEGRCIVIDMSRFNKILGISIEDRYVIAEAGVTIDNLNKHLSKYNYFYPPDPASSAWATIGGTISTNAGGLRAVKYGTTKQWVLGLEVVLPTGRVIHTGGRVLKRSIGYDLTDLMVASEGTLGIVTNATLAIWPRPEAYSAVLAYFSNVASACRVTGKIKKSGITPLMAEFIDRDSMELIRGEMGLRFPKTAGCMLLIGIASTRESHVRLIKKIESIILRSGAIKTERANSASAMERLYKARKYLFTASVEEAKKSGRDVLIADSVVPASELAETLKEMRATAKNSGLEVVMFGHIGDGNIHANILYKNDSKVEVKLVDKLQNKLGGIAIRHQGSVSGEHGIGLIKKNLLKQEFRARGSLENIELMRKIKLAFDPKRLLNRGKIFD